MYKILLALVFSFTFLLISNNSSSREVTIPINLDYQLLDALLIQSSYTDPGQTAQLINEGNGCIMLELSEPAFSGKDNVVNLASKILLHVGTPLGDNCLMPYQWQGSVEVAQIPKLDDQNWELTFETVDTTIYSADHKPIESFDLIWNRLMPVINSYMQDFSIKLSSPVDDLRTFILPLFADEARKEAESLLKSIRPGTISADENRIVATIQADAVELADTQAGEPAEVLSEAEIESFLELWETWDSLLVFLISFLSEQPLIESEKQQMVDLLLETRYEFVTQINDQTIKKDFVRDQFVEGWQLLSQIYRRHLLHDPIQSRLGYLSFITAVDALMILDELGPAFGIEISRNGLIRLAKILGGESIELNYSPGPNKALQQLFEAYPEDIEEAGQPSTKEVEPDTSLKLLLRTIEDFLMPAVYAGELPTFAEIRQWQAPRNPTDDYFDRVRQLLEFAYTSVGIRRQISADFNNLYETLIPAIAWQESCFKQFVVKNDKLTYLLSYNNSSVGIMQVNERVWRGIYDTQRLRWDIKYNASAGCEIVDLYLQKYALKRHGPGILSKSETLAQLVYAMYNGGPSQNTKFLKRKKEDKLYESDLLFAKKYDWVKNQSWEHVDKCF